MSVLWTQQFNCFWKREKKKKIPRNAQIDRLYARALERKNCPKAYKKENTGEKKSSYLDTGRCGWLQDFDLACIFRFTRFFKQYQHLELLSSLFKTISSRWTRCWIHGRRGYLPQRWLLPRRWGLPSIRNIDKVHPTPPNKRNGDGNHQSVSNLESQIYN